MNKKYNISVIVCCYNSEKTIESCLNSLNNQSCNNLFIEVVLVDDGSADDTQSQINTFLSNNTKNKNISFKYFVLFLSKFALSKYQCPIKLVTMQIP